LRSGRRREPEEVTEREGGEGRREGEGGKEGREEHVTNFFSQTANQTPVDIRYAGGFEALYILCGYEINLRLYVKEGGRRREEGGEGEKDEGGGRRRGVLKNTLRCNHGHSKHTERRISTTEYPIFRKLRKYRKFRNNCRTL
jgi:hypothetical protein